MNNNILLTISCFLFTASKAQFVDTLPDSFPVDSATVIYFSNEKKIPGELRAMSNDSVFRIYYVDNNMTADDSYALFVLQMGKGFKAAPVNSQLDVSTSFADEVVFDTACCDGNNNPYVLLWFTRQNVSHNRVVQVWDTSAMRCLLDFQVEYNISSGHFIRAEDTILYNKPCTTWDIIGDIDDGGYYYAWSSYGEDYSIEFFPGGMEIEELVPDCTIMSSIDFDTRDMDIPLNIYSYRLTDNGFVKTASRKKH